MKKKINGALFLIIIVGIMAVCCVYTQDNVDKCVKAGHDKGYCERGLN